MRVPEWLGDRTEQMLNEKYWFRGSGIKDQIHDQHLTVDSLCTE